MRMVAGLETITSGQIEIDGCVVNDLEPAERDIAMVFQNYALYPHMSVFQNMAYGLKISQQCPRTRSRRRVEIAAQILELGHLLERRPRQLSGGPAPARVAMGAPSCANHRCSCSTNRSSNLDAKLRVAMRLELLKLHRRLGTTSLYVVTHDQVEAADAGASDDRDEQGRSEQIGTPMEVFERPASTFVAGSIGSPPMNLIPVHAQGDGTPKTRRGRPGRWRSSPPMSPPPCAAAARCWGCGPNTLLLNALGHARGNRNGGNAGVRATGTRPLRDADVVVRCTTRQLQEATIKPGDQMNIGPDGRHPLHWFDQDSGKRIQGT